MCKPKKFTFKINLHKNLANFFLKNVAGIKFRGDPDRCNFAGVNFAVGPKFAKFSIHEN